MVQKAVDTWQQTPIDFQKDDSQAQSAVFWNKNMYIITSANCYHYTPARKCHPVHE